MKEYIEKILHQDVQISPYSDMGRLPLSYRSSYDLKLMTVGGQIALLAAHVEKTPLTVSHEIGILQNAGFKDVRIMRSWGATYTVLAIR